MRAPISRYLRFEWPRVTGLQFPGPVKTLSVCYFTYLTTPSLLYSVILSVLDPRKCEYLKDYSFDFEHAYTTTYLAS